MLLLITTNASLPAAHRSPRLLLMSYKLFDDAASRRCCCARGIMANAKNGHGQAQNAQDISLLANMRSPHITAMMISY